MIFIPDRITENAEQNARSARYATIWPDTKKDFIVGEIRDAAYATKGSHLSSLIALIPAPIHLFAHMRGAYRTSILGLIAIGLNGMGA